MVPNFTRCLKITMKNKNENKHFVAALSQPYKNIFIAKLRYSVVEFQKKVRKRKYHWFSILWFIEHLTLRKSSYFNPNSRKLGFWKRKEGMLQLRPLNPIILSWKIWLFLIHNKVSENPKNLRFSLWFRAI